MGLIILILVGLLFLVTPIAIVVHIFRRLNNLSRRVEENFAGDQADKLVLRRALERLRQLEETVEHLSATQSPAAPPAKSQAPASVPLPDANVGTGRPQRVSLSFPDLPATPASPPTSSPPPSSSKPVQASIPRPLPPRPGPSAPQPIEWEALIGGNILNKVGAFILVIGLALFLYYSLDAFGPTQKLLIGVLLGGGFVGAGVMAERAASDPIFIRGLLGAGWSALYFTAYASHGLEATRVIDDPMISIFLMMIVAAGMIGHSLRFASEATTGLTFVIAFAGLAIGPSGRFTSFAAFLLSAILVALSFRFNWGRLVIFGIITTYPFHLIRPAYLHTGDSFEILIFNQLLLTAVWLGFESFGVIQPSRVVTPPRERGLAFILNALVFILVSYALWPPSLLEHQYWFWGIATALYLASGYLRHAIFPALPATDTAEDPRWAPSPDVVFCLASAAALMLSWSKLPSTLVAVAWGLLCLIQLEAGLRRPFPSLRKMGHLVGVLAFCRLFLSNLATDGETAGISHRVLTIVPMIVLYFQIFLRCTESGAQEICGVGERTFSRTYLYLPVILLVALARFELGRGLATPAWAMIALALQLIGTRWKLVDFRRQAVVLAALTAVHAWGTDLRSIEAEGIFADPLLIGLVTIAGLFASQATASREEIRRVQDFEGLPTGVGDVLENRARLFFSLSGSFVLTFLLYLKISGSLLSLAWAFTAALMLVFGFMFREKPSRYAGLILMGVCLVKLFFHDLRFLGVPFRILSFVILGLVLMGISWVYSRYQDKIREYL